MGNLTPFSLENGLNESSRSRRHAQAGPTSCRFTMCAVLEREKRTDMRKGLFALAALIGLVALTAEAQLNQKQPPATLKAGVVQRANLKEATVEKILKAIGPA